MSRNNPANERKSAEDPEEDVEVLTLPKPGQAIDRAERKVKVFGVKITKDLKAKDMKELLKVYGLPVSGKREILLQRLRKYAEDPEQWSSQFLPARGRERGDISSRRAGNSHAARRIIDQFGRKESQMEYGPRRGNVQVSIVEPLPTESAIAAQEKWVQKVLERRTVSRKQSMSSSALEQPVDPAAAQGTRDLNAAVNPVAAHEPGASGRLVEPSGQADVGTEGGVGIGVGQTPHEKSRAITGFRRLERRVVDLDLGIKSELTEVRSQLTAMQLSMSAISRFTAPLQSPAHSPSPSSHFAPAGSASTSRVDTLRQSTRAALVPLANSTVLRDPSMPRSDISSDHGPRSPSVSSTHPNAADEPLGPHTTIPSDNLMLFELDGERIPFDRTTVPNPPQVSFANDLSRLFREWHQSTLLVISGRGIPIKHWAWFYKKRTHIKPQVWDVMRAKWNKWKSLVEERDRFPSDEAFWATYSDASGKRLNQQSILALLQGNRDTENKRDAAAALKFFGNDLSRPEAHGYFMYKKDNVRSVFQKPEAIARKWRELLVDHPEISAAFARTQHGNGQPSAASGSAPGRPTAAA
ncbi:hypothetical protein PYCCODRAFT_1463720 [Trametes coccinea BRFM310]|uniref:SAP domain-containing protein n=1 Tax=Trametes coccinea (strain BRFM310) TaxID=1353009 RepID=A0A1Y2J234_TRAC3|nr:hypothetical protein PYCCODRAFT_1463720 [Trametes coccinea BRFM310]